MPRLESDETTIDVEAGPVGVVTGAEVGADDVVGLVLVVGSVVIGAEVDEGMVDTGADDEAGSVVAPGVVTGRVDEGSVMIGGEGVAVLVVDPGTEVVPAARDVVGGTEVDLPDEVVGVVTGACWVVSTALDAAGVVGLVCDAGIDTGADVAGVEGLDAAP